MDVMVMTSESVRVEEGTKSDGKGSGWCVTGAAEQVRQTLRLPDQ